MAIIATKDDDAKAETSYPKLMEGSDGLIVLMTERGMGTVVAASKHWPIGQYSDEWHMPSFTDYHGTVTLKNGSAE